MIGLGVDIGGSHVSSCIIIPTDDASSTATPMYKSVVPLSSTDRSYTRVLASIVECIRQTLLHFNSNKDQNTATCPIAIGVGLPGNADPDKGTARYLPNFTGWPANAPIVSDLRVAFKESKEAELQNLSTAPMFLRNDGRMAATAEAMRGAGVGSKIFAMLTLGTGIGGALIINRTLFDGISFDAGDFGHHTIHTPNPIACVCGKRACFEQHASATGLVRHYRMLQSQVTPPDDSRDMKTQVPDAVENAEGVLNLMRRGDVVAINAWMNYKNDLAEGLANLVTFYNPDIIALGGGLGQAQELFTPSSSSVGLSNGRNEMEELVDSKTLPATRGIVRIVPAVLGADAGVIGAALFAMNAH